MKASASTRIRSHGKLQINKIHIDEIKSHQMQLELLRKSFSLEPNTIPVNITDFQLIQFLNSVSYNVSEAKEVLKLSYRHKKDNNVLFSGRNPQDTDLQEAWGILNIFTLPLGTAANEKLVYCGLLDPDPSHFKHLPAMKLFTMAVEATLITEGLYPGYVVILDASHISVRHVPLSSIPSIKKFLYYVQEGIPLKITQVHVINVSPIVMKIYTVLKPFLKQELITILNFHTNGLENFHKVVPKELLPKELGGNLSPMKEYQNEFKAKVESLAEWYQIEEGQRREEALSA
ncbi:clavesin-2 isoform X2 [Halyomorpha halys]|nr:clavesin-2-like isoform X2 [Halyomorpha halys]